MKLLSIQSSRREEFIDVTSLVAKEVSSSRIRNGICVTTSLHTTGGVTVNENADPSVVKDILNIFNKMAPPDAKYSHTEGNSDAHIKTSLVGNSVTLIVKNGELVLGTWQGIYFCEFDGPRTRTLAVEIISSK